MSSSELVFSVQDFQGSEKWETGCPGFLVQATLADINVPIGEAEVFEGYLLGWRGNEELPPEPDSLYIHFVNARYVTRKAPQGIGTALVHQALDEGVSRGYQIGRADVIHPRMISVLGRCVSEGRITDLELYAGNPKRQPRDRLRDTGEPVLLEEARNRLNADADPRYDGASPSIAIRTIFSIVQ